MTVFNKAEELELCGFVGKCMASPQSYESHIRSYYRKPTNKEIASKAQSELEAARAKDVEAHERNLLKIETNKVIREAITDIMKQVRIPDSYSERDFKSRARMPKLIRHDAGYLGDLNRTVKINDGFEAATFTYERLKRTYTEYAQDADRVEEARVLAEAREIENKLKARRENIKLAELILRYALPETVEWHDVLEALRAKDQRLDLAVAMQQTRGDWSDGYYRVSSAIDRFTVVTPEDAAIQTDILSCFNDDIDGRVFRDTEWNYSRLFSEASGQQLSSDIQYVLQHAGDA